MWYTNIYSNIMVYKNIEISIKKGCATRSLYASSGPKAEGVPTYNQRERWSGPCRLWGGLHKAHHIVPTALLIRVQRLRNLFIYLFIYLILYFKRVTQLALRFCKTAIPVDSDPFRPYCHSFDAMISPPLLRRLEKCYYDVMRYMTLPAELG